MSYGNQKAVCVIGGGLVGLSTAYSLLLADPSLRVTVLEKENGLAQHQSGRNSGVIHSGIYYAPGSLKAKNCARGKALLEEFCRKEKVPFETCGKLIVATTDAQIPALSELQRRAEANGAATRWMKPEEFLQIEPNVAGVAALHVPGTGIVDFTAAASRLRDRILHAGGEVRCGARVDGIYSETGGLCIETSVGEVRAEYAINCAGLHCDRIYRMAGGSRDVAICPFRGEYYLLREERSSLVRGLIYPVPDPQFPFLGVHFTRRINGRIDCGPNAVLALAREGYRKTHFDSRDVTEMMRFPGLRRFLLKHWRYGVDELTRSLSKRRFVQSLQTLVPAVTSDDLEPTHSGIRAQAILADGTIVQDFLVRRTTRMIHLLNAPSPAATSCLSIGETLAELVLQDRGSHFRATGS